MNEMNEKCEPQDKHLENQLNQINEEIAGLEATQEATERAVDRLMGYVPEGQNGQIAQGGCGDEPFANRLGYALLRLERLRSRATQDLDRLNEAV